MSGQMVEWVGVVNERTCVPDLKSNYGVGIGVDNTLG